MKLTEQQTQRLIDLACTAASNLRDLSMGWLPRELAGGNVFGVLPELVHFLRMDCGIDDEHGWDCEAVADANAVADVLVITRVQAGR